MFNIRIFNECRNDPVFLPGEELRTEEGQEGRNTARGTETSAPVGPTGRRRFAQLIPTSSVEEGSADVPSLPPSPHLLSRKREIGTASSYGVERD